MPLRNRSASNSTITAMRIDHLAIGSVCSLEAHLSPLPHSLI